MQVVGVENLFFIIREVIPVANVIEVGTAHGGLANILASVFTDLTVHTYDIISWEPEIFKENIQVHLSDCWAPAFIDEYQSTLKDGVTLFVIDGGDKAKEINIISRHAKRGDILMVHDYCTDEVEFQATGKQIWNYLEIQESDIELELLKRSDLFSEGLKFAWGIYEGTAS
jgi:cephalosporin hydroxylase